MFNKKEQMKDGCKLATYTGKHFTERLCAQFSIKCTGSAYEKECCPLWNKNYTK
jgi:hypothetical protein